MNNQQDIIYCIDIGVYDSHLTLNKAYQIVERDKKKMQTRIKGDSGRLVWISDYLLNKTLTPEFELWLESDHLGSDNEWDSKNDTMTIGVKLPDCRCFSLDVSTYIYFESEIMRSKDTKDVASKYIIPPDLLVEDLSRELINKIISSLLRHDMNLDEAFSKVVFSVELPRPWVEAIDLPDLGESIKIELETEVGDGHILFGKEVSVKAKREDNDTVLLSLENEQLAMVHLTWSGKTETNNYPRTQIFHNEKHFWEDVIRDSVDDLNDY